MAELSNEDLAYGEVLHVVQGLIALARLQLAILRLQVPIQFII